MNELKRCDDKKTTKKNQSLHEFQFVQFHQTTEFIFEFEFITRSYQHQKQPVPVAFYYPLPFKHMKLVSEVNFKNALSSDLSENLIQHLTYTSGEKAYTLDKQ